MKKPAAGEVLPSGTLPKYHHRFFKGSFKFVQKPFKLCTQVPAIISLVIKKRSREAPAITHCALDHARAAARSRPDNKQGCNAITYKNNAVSFGFGGCSISFYRKLSYNKAKLLQACVRNYISAVRFALATMRIQFVGGVHYAKAKMESEHHLHI